MCRGAVLVLLGVFAAPAARAVVLRGQTSAVRDVSGHQLMVITDMRPELAAKLLSGVENRWIREARSFLAGSSRKLEGEVAHDVVASCTKIANSIVRGSEGDSDKVQEYMDSVCAAAQTTEEDKKLCLRFQEGVSNYMSTTGGDAEFDRDSLDMSRFCEKFYSDTVMKEAAEQKKSGEAAAAKAAKEATEKAKKDKQAQAEQEKAQEKATAAAKKREEDALVTAAKEAIVKVKEDEVAAMDAEKVADELTSANASKEKLQEKEMESESKEADAFAAKARKEMEHAADVEAAEVAKAKAKKTAKKAPKKAGKP